MRVRERFLIKGEIVCRVIEPKTGRVVKTIRVNNLIPTVLKELVARMMIDESGYDTGITYFAIGTSNTTPLITDTILGNEVSRKAITKKERASNIITLSTYFVSTSCDYNIKEIGAFGHSTATATKDTGVLAGHALLAYDNSSGNYDLSFDYIFTFG